MRALSWLAAALLLLSGVGLGRADEQAALKAVVDRAVKAMGGEARLAKFKAATGKEQGKIASPEATYTSEVSIQMPTQFRFDMELDIGGNKVKQLMVFGKDKGWVKVAEMTVDMPKDLYTAFQDYFYAMRLASQPLLLKDRGVKLAPLGEIKVNDQPAVGVQVSRKGHRDVNVYFDKKTGLPIKAETTARDVVGEMEISHEFFFSGFKKFDGVTAHTKMVWKKDGKAYLEREISEFKPEEQLDKTLFEKP